jgi:hypothetical protein
VDTALLTSASPPVAPKPVSGGAKSGHVAAQKSAALEDVLASFEALGARDELPRLFVEMARKGMEAGLEDKALTAVIDVMDREAKA